MTGPTRAHKELSPAVAFRRLPYLRIVDVRGLDEFHGDLGHVPGAQLEPLDYLDPESLCADRSSPLLVTCRSGRRSSEACRRLAAAGFGDVYNLVGGLLAWHAAGLAVCRRRHAAEGEGRPQCDVSVTISEHDAPGEAKP